MCKGGVEENHSLATSVCSQYSKRPGLEASDLHLMCVLAIGLFPHLKYEAKNSSPPTLTGKFMKFNEITRVKVHFFFSGRHCPGEGHSATKGY